MQKSKNSTTFTRKIRSNVSLKPKKKRKEMYLHLLRRTTLMLKQPFVLHPFEVEALWHFECRFSSASVELLIDPDLDGCFDGWVGLGFQHFLCIGPVGAGPIFHPVLCAPGWLGLFQQASKFICHPHSICTKWNLTVSRKYLYSLLLYTVYIYILYIL